MSLAIRLAATGSDGDAGGGRFIDLENDGYYWFLCPHFHKAWERTGRMIDLYGDVRFEGDDLAALVEVIGEAAAEVERRPAEWDVTIGLRNGEPVLDRVSKERLRPLLGDFLSLAGEAARTGGAVTCFGD